MANKKNKKKYNKPKISRSTKIFIVILIPIIIFWYLTKDDLNFYLSYHVIVIFGFMATIMYLIFLYFPAIWKYNSPAFIDTTRLPSSHSSINPESDIYIIPATTVKETQIEKVSDSPIEKKITFEFPAIAIVAKGGISVTFPAGGGWNEAGGKEGFIVCRPEHLLKIGQNYICVATLHIVSHKSIPMHIKNRLEEFSNFKENVTPVWFGLSSNMDFSDSGQNLNFENLYLTQTETIHTIDEILRNEREILGGSPLKQKEVRIIKEHYNEQSDQLE